MAEVELEGDERWQELGKTVGSLRAIVHALAAAAADDLIEKTHLHALDGQGQVWGGCSFFVELRLTSLR
jgi:hypothetical protein